LFYCFVIINCDQKKSKFPKNSNLKINALIHFIWITSTGDEIDGYLYYLGGTLGTLTLGSLAASVAYYFATRPVPERPLVPLENQSPLLEVCWFRNWSTLISSITSFNIQLRTVCLEFSLRLGCVWGRTGESPEACGPKRAWLLWCAHVHDHESVSQKRTLLRCCRHMIFTHFHHFDFHFAFVLRLLAVTSVPQWCEND